MIQLQSWEPLLDGFSDPTICLNGAGQVLYGNEAARTLLGRNASELEGNPLRHLLAESSALPAFEGSGTQVVRESCELTLLRKDGVRVRAECSRLPLSAMPAGGLHCLVLRERPHADGSTREPSGQSARSGHLVPAAGQAGEQKFRRLLQTMPVAALLWSRQGSVLEVNDHFLRLLGYSRDEFLRLPFSWETLTAPGFAAADAAALHEVASNGACTPYEKELLHKDGSRVSVEFSCSLLDPATPDLVLAFATDLSRQRRAECALRKSRERFDIVAQTTRDGVWEQDLVTGEVFRSARWFEIQGYSGPEDGANASFESWLERVHPDYRDYVRTRLQLHLDKGLPLELVYLHLHASGEYRWQRCSGQAIRARSGKPLKMVGAISDIMHQKLVEEEVLREKEMSDSIINSLPGIFYLINEEGEVLRWNGNLETVTGMGRRELNASPERVQI
ncbi:MAG: PAS domain S-box protein, partial [Chitinophagaceae bacterium]